MKSLKESLFDDDLTKKDFVCHPKDKYELRDLVEKAIRIQGPDANLNYIDVSGIRSMSSLFNGWNGIGNIKIDKWDVSNCDNMDLMFNDCVNFNADVSNWDMRKVENINYMFCNCKKFDCDLSKWRFNDNLQSYKYTFKGCESFKGAGLDKWPMNYAVTLTGMFSDCKKFDCDLSGWAKSSRSFVYMSRMFDNCKSFKGKGLDKWEIKKELNYLDMYHMFEGCKSLKKLPVWYKDNPRDPHPLNKYLNYEKS